MVSVQALLRSAALIGGCVVTLLTVQMASAQTPTVTPTPSTATPVPTNTPTATNTPAPTNTPAATSTPSQVGDAGRSSLVANPTTVPADGSSTSSVTATLRDSNGNIVAGKTITLSANCCSSTIIGGGVSDGNGNVAFLVKDGTAETVTYTAKDTTDSSVTITQTAQVTFGSATPTPGPTVVATPSGATPHDNRYFSQTGFRVDADPVWNYYNARGGLTTFGYPTSRTFQFMGFQTQFFQRQIVQLDANGNARLLNLLDQGLFPYTNVNGSTFPGPNPSVQAGVPLPSSPTYLPDMMRYIQQNAPNSLNGQNVNFYNTFLNTVSAAQAFGGGGGDVGLLPGFDLEVWGAITSQPAVDPRNGNFVYVRFQRGIMMFDASSGLTQPVLLADYFKAVLMGRNLPPDLQLQAQGSQFYGQYNSAQPNGVNNPGALPATSMQFAFDPQ